MATIEEVTYDKIWDRTLAEKSDFSCDRINEAISLLDKGNKLLDVGCGEGTLLDWRWTPKVGPPEGRVKL